MCFFKGNKSKSHIKFKIIDGKFFHLSFPQILHILKLFCFTNFLIEIFLNMWHRHRVSVTFFNEFGETFERILKQIADGQVVIIISSTKVNKYDGTFYNLLVGLKYIKICLHRMPLNMFPNLKPGEIGLTNYPATRFYLNSNHYSVKEHLDRYDLIMQSLLFNIFIFIFNSSFYKEHTLCWII